MTARRVKPLPKDWAKTKQRILARDYRTCYWCGGPAEQVDHKTPACDGGGDEDSNLAAICSDCHEKKTGREAQRRSPWRSARRDAEQHPGMVEPARTNGDAVAIGG